MSTAALAVFITARTRSNTIDLATRSAVTTIDQFKILRGYYTKAVVGKVKRNTDLAISFDHDDNEETIPLPATMIHDLSELFSQSGEQAVQLKLYSEFPFPNRADRKLDNYALNAVEYFKRDPQGIYVETAATGRGAAVRVAIADFMQAQACVDCHNTWPGTPKNDWSLGDIRGVLEVVTPIAKAISANRQVTISVFIVLGTVLAALIVGLIALFNKTVRTPLSRFSLAFERLTDGELDEKISVRSVDEIDAVSQRFNTFTERLNQIIQSIKDVTVAAQKITDALEQSSERTVSALEQMSGNIASMKDQVVSIDIETQKTGSSSEEVRSFIRTVNDRIQSQTAAMTESSASIEQMASSIQNVARLSSGKRDAAVTLRDKANLADTELNVAVEKIRATAAAAEVIEELIAVINGIASQTNLLAFNAAIEAAHAGESGKGFAVVADEIRKLAEETAANSKRVSDSLSNVVTNIRDSEMSLTRNGEIFGEIVTEIDGVVSGLEEMKNTMDEMSTGSTQVTEGLELIVQTTHDVSGASKQMDDQMGRITESVRQLSQMVSQAKTGMEELLLGVNEIYQMAENVTGSGRKNSSNVTQLEALMNEFKTR